MAFSPSSGSLVDIETIQIGSGLRLPETAYTTLTAYLPTSTTTTFSTLSLTEFIASSPSRSPLFPTSRPPLFPSSIAVIPPSVAPSDFPPPNHTPWDDGRDDGPPRMAPIQLIILVVVGTCVVVTGVGLVVWRCVCVRRQRERGEVYPGYRVGVLEWSGRAGEGKEGGVVAVKEVGNVGGGAGEGVGSEMNAPMASGALMSGARAGTEGEGGGRPAVTKEAQAADSEIVKDAPDVGSIDGVLAGQNAPEPTEKEAGGGRGGLVRYA